MKAITPPSYGADVLSRTLRRGRILVLFAAASTAAIAVILGALYLHTGEKGYLIGLAIVLALSPIDILILKTFASQLAGRETLLEELISHMKPRTYGLHSSLYGIVISAELQDGRILVVSLEDKRVEGVLLPSPVPIAYKGPPGRLSRGLRIPWPRRPPIPVLSCKSLHTVLSEGTVEALAPDKKIVVAYPARGAHALYYACPIPLTRENVVKNVGELLSVGG